MVVALGMGTGQLLVAAPAEELFEYSRAGQRVMIYQCQTPGR